jgi:hypothetical protein
MTSKIKILMIDAFKPEYLEHAPYLKSLTMKNQWGELIMPTGFWGGMKWFFNGENDIKAFFFRSQNSSLKWTKRFYWIGRLPLEIIINLIRLIKREKLFRIGNIPLKELYKFDTEIQKPLEKIKGVDYVYFGEIDSISHKYGTKSEMTINAIKEIDKKISNMEFDIILSDHGMVDINKTINLPITNDCFIDSTMARYWKEKPMIDSSDGKWIEGSEKYGDYIFLANPGVLILPNFYQGNKKLKAMHGYSEKSKEMNAIYILNSQGNKKNLHVRELNKIFLERKNGKQQA